MLDETLKSCLPCGLHAPSRNYYFDGKLLVARDFTDEQDYHRGLRHLHNQLLHGTGTVCGLKVIQHPQEGCRRENLVVEPGMALDCCGQELILPERRRIDVAAMLAADPDLAELLDGGMHLVVGLRRCDRGAEPLPRLLPGCGAGEATEYGRVTEDVELVLFAADPAGAAAAAIPRTPRLDWVHTMTFGAQTPGALHVNEVERRLQVAVDAAGGAAHGYVFVADTEAAAQTHDLAALLEGPAELTDTQSSRETGLVFFAGHGWDSGAEGARGGIGIWRAGALSAAAHPLAILPCDGRYLRLAVSPVSGALFVLETDGGSRARLLSYGAAALSDWLVEGGVPAAAPDPQAKLEFSHGFGTAGSPFRRGAQMLKVSPDGRFLAIAGSVGAAAERLYLIDIAALNGGSVTEASARPPELPEFDGSERLMALDWSLDGRYLYLLGQRPAAGGRVILRRLALTGDGNRLALAGQGAWIEGTALDLAVAPTESRAYLALTDAAGATRLTHLDMDTVIALSSDSPAEVSLAPDALRVEGAGRAMRLAGNGRRLYLAAGDDGTAAPDRGLVAVIDIADSDCGAHFLDPLEACPACAEDEDHVVILAHLPHYRAGDAPRMMDADQAAEGDAAIDNLGFRSMVPSAATLKRVIDCILAQGVAEGPPGPRGNPGADGAAGLSVTEVGVTMGAAGTDPVAETNPADGGLRLDLTIPAAADGAPGADGLGIDAATIEYRADLSQPWVDIVQQGRQRVLDIDLPRPAAGPAERPVNPVTALSWYHGKVHPDGPNFFGNLWETGIAVGFERPVAWSQFGVESDVEGKLSRSLLVELQREMPASGGAMVWARLGYLAIDPIDYADDQVSDGLLSEWTPLDHQTETCRGFMLRQANETDWELVQGEWLRLVFHTDFIVDLDGRPLDGTFLGGKLPTGKGGAPGDTFRSWFRVPARDGGN
ncbi:collagen-like protein [Mangrovicoccus algicola]|uniref:Collagen-like protein n=1 Tax=Mangrovicoccus algicola TaxID=2771008 RepID=A0A8J6Z8M6_9RHOB|nr:collagen-like protein [Mangrovicoccus algicola]MBE3638375.1 collagen-like protein [Mangrovicoccus algicola]